MERDFGSVLSELRRSADLSQRTLAADLHISQALLSHYENGTREPGLPFVCRACTYFSVSADYLLGRTDNNTATAGVSAAFLNLDTILNKADTPSLREAALSYLSAAAKRIDSRFAPELDELFLAEQASAMSDAELQIIREKAENLK
ncbi:MAG: helix-turn-helix transcriptional regulator [Oscillospiraceae bacterium]